MATNHSEYFYRVVTLLVDGSTQVLRKLFKKYVDSSHQPPWTVDQFLLSNHHIIQKLHTKRILSQDNMDTLFPPSGSCDMETLDITLLCSLLKNICPVNQQEINEIEILRKQRNAMYGHSGRAQLNEARFQYHWQVIAGAMSNLSNLCQDVDFIHEIQDFVRKLKDPSTPLDTSHTVQLLKHWFSRDRQIESDLEQINLSLTAVSSSVMDVGNCVSELQHEVDDIKEEIVYVRKETAPISGIETTVQAVKEATEAVVTDTETIKQKLDEVSGNVGSVHTEMTTLQTCVQSGFEANKVQISELTEQNKELSEELATLAMVRDPVLKNLIDNTASMLQVKCQSPFVKTKAYDCAHRVLKEKGQVTLVGNPGEGKTRLAFELVKTFARPGRYVEITECSEYRHVDTDNVDVVLVDDVFGKYGLEHSKLSQWRPVLEKLEAQADTGKIKVIVTTRSNVMKEARATTKHLKTIQNSVLLSSKDLTGKEKEDIFSSAMQHKGKSVSGETKQDCIEVFNSPIGFPYCCNMFFSDMALVAKGSHFFANPTPIFLSALETMSEDKVTALVVLFYCKNKLPLNSLDPLHLTPETELKLTRVTQMLGIPAIPPAKLRSSIELMDGTYITITSGQCSFIHNVLYESIGVFIGRKYPREILNVSNFEFLCEYVRTEEGVVEEEVIKVPPAFYPEFADRLIEEVLERRQVLSVSNHPSLMNDTFVDVFFHQLKSRGEVKRFLTQLDSVGYQSMALQRTVNYFFLLCQVTSKKVGQHLLELTMEAMKCEHDPQPNSCWKCRQKDLALSEVTRNGWYEMYRCLMKGASDSVSSKHLKDAIVGCNADIVFDMSSTFQPHGKGKLMLNDVQAILELFLDEETFEYFGKRLIKNGLLFPTMFLGEMSAEIDEIAEFENLMKQVIRSAVQKPNAQLAVMLIEHCFQRNVDSTIIEIIASCNNKHMKDFLMSLFNQVPLGSTADYTRSLVVLCEKKSFDLFYTLLNSQTQCHLRKLPALTVVLESACKFGDETMCQSLLDIGVTPSLQCLLQSLKCNKVDVCKVILQQTHLEDEELSAVLRTAYEYDGLSVVDFLLEKGVPLDHECLLAAVKGLPSHSLVFFRDLRRLRMLNEYSRNRISEEEFENVTNLFIREYTEGETLQQMRSRGRLMCVSDSRCSERTVDAFVEYLTIYDKNLTEIARLSRGVSNVIAIVDLLVKTQKWDPRNEFVGQALEYVYNRNQSIFKYLLNAGALPTITLAEKLLGSGLNCAATCEIIEKMLLCGQLNIDHSVVRKALIEFSKADFTCFKRLVELGCHQAIHDEDCLLNTIYHGQVSIVEFIVTSRQRLGSWHPLTYSDTLEEFCEKDQHQEVLEVLLDSGIFPSPKCVSSVISSLNISFARTIIDFLRGQIKWNPLEHTPSLEYLCQHQNFALDLPQAMFSLLVDASVHPNIRCLMSAVERMDKVALQMIIDTMKSKKKWSPLQLTGVLDEFSRHVFSSKWLGKNQYEILTILLTAGIPPNVQSLAYVVARGDISTMLMVLEYFRSNNVGMEQQYCTQTLQQFCFSVSADENLADIKKCFELFLSLGAIPNRRCLLNAVKGVNPGLVEILISNVKSSDRWDPDGCTVLLESLCLSFASKGGESEVHAYIQCLDKLVENGIVPNVKCLVYAATSKCQNVDMLNKLISIFKLKGLALDKDEAKQEFSKYNYDNNVIMKLKESKLLPEEIFETV